MFYFHIYIFLIFAFFIFTLVEGEIYTSMASVEKILKTRINVIQAIDIYMADTSEFLKYLQRIRDDMQQEIELASQDEGEYISNPINVFRLIKSLTHDLKYKIFRRQEIIIATFHENLNRSDIIYPDGKDFGGVVMSLNRLKYTYDLDIDDMADGKFYGKQYSKPMTGDECYVMAYVLYEQRDLYSSIDWTEAAIKRVEPKQFHQTYFLLAKLYEELNDHINTIQTYDKLLNKYPNDEHVALEKKLYLQRRDFKFAENSTKTQYKIRTPYYIFYRELVPNYEKLCRGVSLVSLNVSNKLSCYYHSGKSMFLKLAPVKAEVMYLNPEIIMFHDVISDREIDQFLKIGKPRLNYYHLNLSNYYYDASEWDSALVRDESIVDDNECKMTRVLSKRIEHITNMDLGSSKSFFLANYGVGGYFSHHYDFCEQFITYLKGNIMASFILYLSKVELGGSTIFPKLGVTIPVEKGAAVFWRNLHSSCHQNFHTLHGGCPVLKGNKLITSKFIWSERQEFRQPCGLELIKSNNFAHPAFITRVSRT